MSMMKPQFDLLVELIGEVARSRPLRAGLTVETAARLTQYLVLNAIHARLFGADGAAEIAPPVIWEFCAAGLGFDGPAKSRSPKSGRGRRSAAAEE